MEIVWVVVLFAGYIVLVAIGKWRSTQRQKAKIVAWLAEQGAINIDVNQTFDHGRHGTLIYQAEYTDGHGQRRHAVCSVVMGTVQWSDAVEVPHQQPRDSSAADLHG